MRAELEMPLLLIKFNEPIKPEIPVLDIEEGKQIGEPGMDSLRLLPVVGPHA